MKHVLISGILGAVAPMVEQSQPRSGSIRMNQPYFISIEH